MSIEESCHPCGDECIFIDEEVPRLSRQVNHDIMTEPENSNFKNINGNAKSFGYNSFYLEDQEERDSFLHYGEIYENDMNFSAGPPDYDADDEIAPNAVEDKDKAEESEQSDYVAKFKLYQEERKKEPCLCCPPGFWRYLGQHFYNFFYGPPDAYTPMKTALGFPFGLIMAYGLYHALIEPMNLEKETRHLLGGILVIAVSSGYAMSVQVRCIVCLVLPTFFGKQGRSYIGTFALAYLIAGPVNNIMRNGKEITRSLGCAAELSANHTSAKWALKLKPIGEVMSNFQSEGMYMNKVVNRVDTAFEPLKKEVRDEEDTKQMEENTRQVDKVSGKKRGNRLMDLQRKNKVKKTDPREKQAEQKFKKKVTLQCENVWNEGVLRCRSKFKDLEKRCLKAVPFVGYILCLPMKMTFFCELVRLAPGAIGMDCEAANVINPGFGETYVASEDMVNVMDQNFEVNMQYKLVQSKEELDYTSAEEIRKGTMHSFESRQLWMSWFLTILSRLLGFSFMRVVFSCFKYNKKFLSDFNFDNIYITAYFRHVDKRRKLQGKMGLLPLKKSEMAGFIDPWSPKITKSEKKKLSKGTFMLIMRALITGVIIYSDYLLYTVMDIIRRHSRVDYTQVGKHYVKTRVDGDGFMANIVRMFIMNFNAKHEINQVSTNYDCLPQPIALENKYIVYIYFFYGLVWFCMCFEAYGLRIRRMVAAFFYRKREKARILYLFNDLFKKRKGYARHMRHEIRRKARKNQLMKSRSLLASFAIEFPKLLGWLRRFQSGKERCLVCDDTAKKNFVKCQTENCPFGYCSDCWEDVKFRCYACTKEDSEDSDLTEDESETSGEEEV